MYNISLASLAAFADTQQALNWCLRSDHHSKDQLPAPIFFYRVRRKFSSHITLHGDGLFLEILQETLLLTHEIDVLSLQQPQCEACYYSQQQQQR